MENASRKLVTQEADNVPEEKRAPYYQLARDINISRNILKEDLVPSSNQNLTIVRNQQKKNSKWRPARFYYLEDRVHLEMDPHRCINAFNRLLLVTEKPRFLRQYLKDWENLSAEQKRPYEERSEMFAAGKTYVIAVELYKELYKDYITEQFNVSAKSQGYNLLRQEYRNLAPEDQELFKDISREMNRETNLSECVELKRMHTRNDAESRFIRQQYTKERRKTDGFFPMFA